MVFTGLVVTTGQELGEGLVAGLPNFDWLWPISACQCNACVAETGFCVGVTLVYIWIDGGGSAFARKRCT
jgi:hypothetical protein